METTVTQPDHTAFLTTLRGELCPATGCTEPVAIAYAVAKARSCLGEVPTGISVRVSRNMMKNAMGVGIPGTGAAGISLAAALGAFGGDAEASLDVLHGVTPADVRSAKAFAGQNVQVQLANTPHKLYIEATVQGATGEATVVIQDRHADIVRITRNGKVIQEAGQSGPAGTPALPHTHLSIADIYAFCTQVPIGELEFLQNVAGVNWRIAQEGLTGSYGLQVGKSSMAGATHSGSFEDARGYAVSLTAAAADARMAGCQLPVITLCGSGNQGLTAMVPVLALAKYYKLDEETTLRALALSCLVTIHAKQHIGRLSPVCGCAVGSAIGACAAAVQLMGGGLEEINSAISNVIADVAGMICDGAKPGCALKVATAAGSALRCAQLGLQGLSAGSLDGIVAADVETSLQNLGRLGTEGMVDTDRVILDMMVTK